MPEIRVGAYRDKLDDVKKALEGAGLAFHDLDLLVPRLEAWTGTEEDFVKELAIIDKMDGLTTTRKTLLKEWKRIERQVRAVGAPWGTAGGKRRYFEGYAKGAVALGDYIENVIFGEASDWDVYTMVSPILRRFQDLNFGSWHERDVNRPVAFGIQSQPVINAAGGRGGSEGMEPPLEEEAAAQEAARSPKGRVVKKR